MTEEFGIRPEKIRAYIEVLEDHDVCNKKALFFLSKEEVDIIAKECRMGAPTKAKFVELWNSGQNRQQPELVSTPPGSPEVKSIQLAGSNEVVEALPPGSPEVIETLPPGT